MYRLIFIIMTNRTEGLDFEPERAELDTLRVEKYHLLEEFLGGESIESGIAIAQAVRNRIEEGESCELEWWRLLDGELLHMASLLVPDEDDRELFLSSDLNLKILQNLDWYRQPENFQNWINLFNDVRSLEKNSRLGVDMSLFYLMTEVFRYEELEKWLRTSMGGLSYSLLVSDKLLTIEDVWYMEDERLRGQIMGNFNLLVIDNFVKYWGINLEDIGRNIDIVKEVMAVDSEKDLDWESRLLWMIKIMHAFGRGGIEDRDINEALWSVYRRQLEGRLREIQYREKTVGLTVSESIIKEDLEFEIERIGNAEIEYIDWMLGAESFRSGMNEEEMVKVRDHLRAEGKARSLHGELWEARKKMRSKQIAWREDIRHPTAHLRARIGFEVEYSYDFENGPIMELLLEKVGFKQGGGDGDQVTETSPGPFRDPQTAELTWLLMVKYGLIDLYKKKGQTCHTSWEIEEGGKEVVNMVRILQTTRYAYQPRIRGGGDIYRTRIYLKGDFDVPDSRRTEAKAFEVGTGVGMANHLRLAAALGTAVKAYQIVNAKYGPEMIDDNFVALANIWVEAEDKWEEVLFEFGISDFLDRRMVDGGKVALKWGMELLELMSTRMGQLQQSFELGKEGELNLIEEARRIAWETAAEVKKVLRKAEADFEETMEKWEAVVNVDDWRLLQERLWLMWNKFPCGVEEFDMAEYVEVIEQIRQEYYGDSRSGDIELLD